MNRYLLRFEGEGVKIPKAEQVFISKVPGLTILDRSDLILLVDATDKAIDTILSKLEDWDAYKVCGVTK